MLQNANSGFAVAELMLYNYTEHTNQVIMTTVALAAASLRTHGINCRRDWGSAGRWLAEIGNVQYCVGGLTILAAAASTDPIATLESAV